MQGNAFYKPLHTDYSDDGDYHPNERRQKGYRLWFRIPSRAAAVVCIASLILFLGLWMHCAFEQHPDGLPSEYSNLVEKNKELKILLQNLTIERDLQQTNCNKRIEDLQTEIHERGKTPPKTNMFKFPHLWNTSNNHPCNNVILCSVVLLTFLSRAIMF